MARPAGEFDQIMRCRTPRHDDVEVSVAAELTVVAELDQHGNLASKTDSKPPVAPCLRPGPMTPQAYPRPLRVITVDGSLAPTQATRRTRLAAGSDLTYIVWHHAE